MSKFYRVPVIRTAFWICAILLSFVQTWRTRHDILSDGISYLEIAKAYLQHDWSNAFNAYWSPLYSWLLALAFFLLRPSLYWEVATAHLVILAAFLASLFSFEFFLRELLLALRRSGATEENFPATVLYIVGYSAMLFGGLSLVGMGYCSPDMIAFALMFALTGLILRIERTGGSNGIFGAFGILCALFYYARTAFAPSLLIWIAVVVLVLRRRKQSWARPAALMLTLAVALSAPYVIALRNKTGKWTVGESGRLNYGWEVCGADRFIHWQGKPFNIGAPKHPTTEVIASPQTYVFTRPVTGTYPPWYDPSYWYDGIKPHLEWGPELRAVFINLTIALNYFVRSPIVAPACVLILLLGIRRWWSPFISFWPVLTPSLAGMAIYCLVYFEKRYVAANLVIVWITLPTGLRFSTGRLRRWGAPFLALCAVAFMALFTVTRQIGPAKAALADLLSGREKETSVDFAIAERLGSLGLRPGDKVAYIGPGMNANWARLARVRIVGEIPLRYRRTGKPFNNLLVDDTTQMNAFWNADAAKREQVLNAFRAAGAKMVVTDGFMCPQQSSQWPRILSEDQPGIPKFDPGVYSQINSRYLLLGTGSANSFLPN